MQQSDIVSKFREFASIDNLTGKFAKQLKKLGYVNNLIEWVALEKIHGANLSFVTDGSSIFVAKRSGIISESEKFHNSTTIMEKYKIDIFEVYRRVKENNPETKTIQVFGEVFGGYYPGFKHESKPVQKGVYYKPEIDFLVFDIKMNTDIVAFLNKTLEDLDDTTEQTNETTYSWYLSQNEIDQYLKDLPNLRGIPVTAKGNFNDLIDMSPIFVTTIPTLFGLPSIDNNLAEGFVLKTNKRHPAHRSRPIIKNKNNNIFSEVARTRKLITSNDSEVDKYVDAAVAYCTQNRFNNTISKIGPNNKIEKISGIYVADVLKDFEKDLPEDEAIEFKKLIKKVKECINSYLLSENNIELWLREYLEPITV